MQSLAIRGPRSGAQPHVPIEALGNWLGRSITRSTRPGRQLYTDSFELANPPIAYQFGQAMVNGDRTVLGGQLKDGAVAFDGIGQTPALGDGQRRFLADNVLAGVNGGQRQRDVPMIGGRDHDRVDIASGNDFAPVLRRWAGEVLPALLPYNAKRAGDLPCVDVTQRHRFGVRLVQEHRQVPPNAMPAQANETHRYSITGGNCSPRTQGG